MPLGALVPELEREGLVTRTFRRLDPHRQLAVLEAIFADAGERGPAGVNIKEVARRAQVSVGALYTYFGNRDGMLAFAVEVANRSMAAVLGAYGPELAALPVREALAAYVQGGIDWCHATPGLAAFFARGAYQGDPLVVDAVVRPAADAMRGAVSAILHAGAARGEVRGNVDLDATARLVHALVVALSDTQVLPHLNTYLQVLDDGFAPERMLEATLDLVLAGIAPDGRQ